MMIGNEPMIYDTLDEAYKAGARLLAGFSSYERVLIIGSEAADVPAELMSDMPTIVIRARDIIEPNWYGLSNVVRVDPKDAPSGQASKD